MYKIINKQKNNKTLYTVVFTTNVNGWNHYNYHYVSLMTMTNVSIMLTKCHVTSCHDKESQWYTSQCNLSTKQSIYFYKLNTSQLG